MPSFFPVIQKGLTDETLLPYPYCLIHKGGTLKIVINRNRALEFVTVTGFSMPLPLAVRRGRLADATRYTPAWSCRFSLANLFLDLAKV